MNEEKQKKDGQKQSDWAPVAPLLFAGTQFGLICFAGAWLGKWLDERYGTEPWLALTLAFLFASGGFWQFLRTIKKVNEKV